MAVGAWDFFALIWNHPVISCLVLLLFTPALFPVLVYFSPLLISTALCAIALISMNMADSPESEDDPYLRRWQSEQVETEQSKPARQSWFQWVTKVEEKTRVWVDSRFARGKPVQDEKFKWKVVHDDDDENEVSVPSDPSILPPAEKPTKIKYGTRTEDGDSGADDVPSKLHGGSPSSPTKAEKEEEIHSVNVQPPGAGILQTQKENVITRASATEEVVSSVATLSKAQGRPASSGLQALSEEIQRTPAPTSNQKAGPNSLDKSKPSTTPPLSERRDEPEQRGDGNFKPFPISREAVAQRVVQDHAGHAPPSLENAGPVGAQSPPAASVQRAAALGSSTFPLSTWGSSSSSATKADPGSAARSLSNNLMQPAAMVADATPPAQLPVSDQVSPEKVPSGRSLPGNLASKEAKIDGEPVAPEARKPIHTPVAVHLASMNERVAEARMRKPEPTAYIVVKSGDVGDLETDSQENLAESAVVRNKEGEQSISRTVGKSENGRPSSGEVDGGMKLSESESPGFPEVSTEGTSSYVATDSLDVTAVGDRSTDFEKVIFVDESSKVGNSTDSRQQRVVTDGIILCSEVEENKGSGRKTGGDLDVLETELFLLSSDKKGKSKGREEYVRGSDTVNESFIVARATISSNDSEANQFHESILEKRGGEQGSEGKAGSCSVGDFMKHGTKQQPEGPRGETSEVPFSSTGSVAASSVSRNKSDKDLKGEAEDLCAVQTSQGRSSLEDSLTAEQQRHVSTPDQLQNIFEEGRSLSDRATKSNLNPYPRSDVELEAVPDIIPHSTHSEADEAVSSKTSGPDLMKLRSRSFNNKEDSQGGKEGVWFSASVDDEAARDSTASKNAWVKANIEEEYDEYMKEVLSLKKSSSMPSSSRQDRGARKIPDLGKASSLPEKKRDDDDDSDSDSTAVLPIRRRPWTRNHTVDSVEEITARLSKKYNPTWAKVPAREDAGTSRPASALATMDAPKPLEPEVFAISSLNESLSSPVRKGIDSEKTDELAETYMSPMKKVLSAVRNVGNKDKDAPGKNGRSQTPLRSQTPERKGLSSVLNIKRERFTSPLKRVLKSEADGGKRAGFANERKEKVGSSTALAVLAEGEGGSTGKFKDRLITPLKKVFLAEASGGGGGGKKADIPQDLTPQGSPAIFRPSPGQKQTAVRDEVAADGKFRDRFILPLRKKFSSDSKEERKKGDSTGAMQTPERSGPLTAKDTSGGDGSSISDRIKSQDKKFTLSWTKKRAKYDQSTAPPQAAQEEISPGSIFQKPRSPGISEKTTARLITHEKGNSPPPAVIDEAGYSTEEFRSPERNFFWPPANQQEKKEKESSRASKEKEKAVGGKSSSWWTRKRDKVVVEEATVAQAKQPTRDGPRSSPERIIAGRSVDSGVDRITAADRNPPASSLLKTREKDEQQPFSVRSSPSEEIVSSARTHRREHSDTLPPRLWTHERRMSLSEWSTLEKESTSAERTSDQNSSMPEGSSLSDKSNTVRKPQHVRRRSTDMMDLRPEAHLYKSRSATGAADHAQERYRNEILPSGGSRSDPEVNKLYRNLDSPSASNAEIRITDKLKVPLEEVLSLLAAGDSSTRNSTAARESSSSEETSSSEEEWSSSSDEDEAEPAAVQRSIPLVQSRESLHCFNKGSRQATNVDT